MTDAIKFTLDGREVEAQARRDHLAGRETAGHRHPAPVLAARARLSSRRQLPRLHGRDRGRARARGILHPQADRGHEGGHGFGPGEDRAENGHGAAARRPARARGRAPSRIQAVAVGGPHGRERLALPGTREPDARPQPPRDGGAPGRLHPLQSVRARLPRGAGQRRHRHGVPQRRLEDRVRHGRSDGWEHLRRLRRVRPGLPHGRPDAVFDRRRAGRRPSGGRPPGRQRVPVLRGRLPDHLSHQGRQDPLRDGTQRPGE